MPNPELNLSVAFLFPYIGFVVTFFIAVLFLLFFFITRQLDWKIRIEAISVMLLAVFLSGYLGFDTLTVLSENFGQIVLFTKIKSVFILFSALALFVYLSIISANFKKPSNKIISAIFLTIAILFTALVIGTDLVITSAKESLMTSDGMRLMYPEYGRFFMLAFVPYLYIMVIMGLIMMIRKYSSLSKTDRKGFTIILTGSFIVAAGGLFQVARVLKVPVIETVQNSFSFGLIVSTMLFAFSTITRMLLSNRRVMENRVYLEKLIDALKEMASNFDKVSDNITTLTADVGNYADKIVVSVSESSQSMDKLIEFSDEGSETIIQSKDIVNKNITVFKTIQGLMQRQKDAVKQTEDFISELSKAVEGINLNSNEMAEAISSLTEKIDSGKILLENNVKSMENIKQSVEKVFHIVEIIDDISEQINILAMNAAIEAAHAGGHGKGFAVVAEEIRNVSSSTLQKAESIKRSIIEVIENSEKGQNAVSEISEIFANFSSNIERLFIYILGVIDSSDKLKDNAENISKDMDYLSKVAFTNRRKSEEEGHLNSKLLDLVNRASDFIDGMVKNIKEEKQKSLEMNEAVENIRKTTEEFTLVAAKLNNFRVSFANFMQNEFKH